MQKHNRYDLVSIIIPCYNSGKYLKTTIDSVLAQSFNNYELIIVDDGSTDNTQSIVTEYAKSDSRIYYCKTFNKGTAAARNYGINKSKGKYIALLDHDDVWLANKLDNQMKLLKSNDYGMVYCKFAIINEADELISVPDREYCSGHVWKKFLKRNYIPTASQVLIKYDCFDELGGFNEEYFGVDDYEMYLRITEKYQIGYCDEVLVYWRQHQGNTSNQRIKMLINGIKIWKNLIDSQLYSLEDKVIFKDKLNADYHEIAKLLFRAGDYREAREYFYRAGFRVCYKNICYLSATYLPSCFIDILRKVKRNIDGKNINHNTCL